MVLLAIRARLTRPQQLAWLHFFTWSGPRGQLAQSSWERLMGVLVARGGAPSLWMRRQSWRAPTRIYPSRGTVEPTALAKSRSPARTDTFRLELLDSSGKALSVLGEVFGHHLARTSYRTGQNIETLAVGRDVLFLAQKSELL